MTDEAKKDGRPRTEFTEQEINKVEALAAVLNTKQISDYFGISHVTFKAIRDRDERVSFAYKNGKAKAIASIGANLIKTAKNGNIAAMIFYLKTQAGWKETQVVEVQDVKSFNDMYNDETEGEVDKNHEPSEFNDMYEQD